MVYDHIVELDTMQRKPVEISTKQYDDAGRRVKILPKANGKVMTIPSTAAFTVQVSKPDGTFVRAAGSKLTEDGVTYICFTLTLQMLARYGREVIDVTIRDGNTSITTMSLINNIQRAAVQDGDVESSSELDDLQTALQDMDTLRGYKQAAETAATTATTKAGEATTAATTATNKASAASTSESNAQTYMNQAKTYRDQTAGYVGEGAYSFLVDEEGYICVHYEPDAS